MLIPTREQNLCNFENFLIKYERMKYFLLL